MICRHFRNGQRLNVADLNEITVLIDRTEAEFSEVALNSWRPGLVGPPHRHEEKDQLFYIVAGEGTVEIEGHSFHVRPGALVYVPASLNHRTIVIGDEALEYLLFNFFLSEEKEGHGSFAEHIEKVKAIRKRQAESGRADVEATPQTRRQATHAPVFLKNLTKGELYDHGGNRTRLLLARSQTARCEAALVSWPVNAHGPTVISPEKEQVFFVLNGEGTIEISGEKAQVKPGQMIFVPRNAPHTIETSAKPLEYLSVSTFTL